MADRSPAGRLAAACLSLTVLAGVNAHAITVPFPYVDVTSLDTGTDVTSDGSTLTMTGSVSQLFTASGVFTPIAPSATFTLSATYSATLTGNEQAGSNTYDFTSGTISINNGTNLLTATFNDLQLTAEGTSLFQLAVGSSALTYTGGSLAGTLGGGAIVGSLTVTGYTPNGNDVADLSQAFTGNNLTAKVGAVVTPVPLPASLPLLLSGLLGAGAFAVRNRSSRTAQTPG